MNIFLRCIFINCFLLVAMHSLIIARESNENDSDNQTLIKKTLIIKTTEIVDDTHHLLSEQISSVSDELDSFFGEERMDGDFNKSKIRLNFITTGVIKDQPVTIGK